MKKKKNPLSAAWRSLKGKVLCVVPMRDNHDYCDAESKAILEEVSVQRKKGSRTATFLKRTKGSRLIGAERVAAKVAGNILFAYKPKRLKCPITGAELVS